MPLTPLSAEPGTDVLAGAFDVRGWTVRSLMDGEIVGVVHAVLATPDGRPVYLDLDLEPLGKHVLLPIGAAHADRERERVWLPGLHREGLGLLPAYDGDPDAVGRAYERAVLHAYRDVLTGGAEVDPGGVGFEAESAADAASPRLAPISELPDFHVAEGEPDPRGWPVATADGARVGSVSDLIADTRALKVRYLVCAVDEAALGLERLGRSILVPAGHARLLGHDRVVQVDALTPELIERSPVYAGETLNHTLEREVEQHYATDLHGKFYNQSYFDARDFYRTASS